MEQVGLATTLLLQSPCACKSPGAAAQPSREGRWCFLPKHQQGRELSPLNGTRRLPSTHSSNRMLHGNIKPLMVSSTLPQEGVGTPEPAPPYQTTQYTSHFPTSPIMMPSSAGGQVQKGKFPTCGQARLAPHLHRTHRCPPDRGAGTAPPCRPCQAHLDVFCWHMTCQIC